MISFQEVASTNQIKEVAELAKNIWQSHYSPIIGEKQVVYMLANFQSEGAIQTQIQNNIAYYLINKGNKPVGYLAYEIKNSELFVSKLYILQAVHGKGVGKRSVHFFIEQALKKKCTKISLQVNKHNISAINFYKQQNFKIIKSIIVDIGNGFVMDDYWMEKELQ